MPKKYGIVIVLIVIILISIIYVLSIPSMQQETTSIEVPLGNSEQESTAPAENSRPLKLEVIVEDAKVPWSIVWTIPERMLFTERSGNLREVINNQLNPQPILNFPEVVVNGEQGLMGLAVDPQYQQNRFLYVARAKPAGNTFQVDIIRLIDPPSGPRIDKVLVEKVPAGNNHAGTRLKIGPDRKLYITTGDALNRSLAQDPQSLAGKILRYNLDGSIPADNPFPGTPVWSLGHRNPQGLDWDSRNGNLWSTEHGPSGFDGPGGGDEVNLISISGNYGWPLVSHNRSQSGLIDPQQLYTPAVAPASLLFYSSPLIPQFTYQLFFGALRGEGIYQLTLNSQDPAKITSSTKLSLTNNLGRIRELAQGPEGALYFSTSNQDGRGKPKQGDDKIYKIIPE